MTLVFTGCGKKDDEGSNPPADTNPTDTPPAPVPLNKDVVLNAFNNMDLTDLDVSVTDPTALIAELLTGLKLGGEIELSMDGGSAIFEAAMKDGLIYASGMGEEFYVWTDGDTVAMFEAYDSVWEVVDEMAISDLMGEVEAPDSAAMLEAIKIPTMTAEHLTQENGTLVLSNEYIKAVILENITLIAGAEPTPDQLAEFTNELNTMIDNFGLKIAFKISATNITEVSMGINLTADKMQSLGMVETGVDAHAIFSATIATSADGKMLTGMSMAYDLYQEGEIDQDLVINVAPILNASNEIVGLDADLAMTAKGQIADFVTFGGGSIGNVAQAPSEAVIYHDMSFTADIYMDLSKASAAVGTEFIKVDLKVEETNARAVDYETGAALSFGEIGALAADYQENIAIGASVKVASAGVYTVTGSMTNDGEVMNVNGSVYIDAVPNFPTTIPSEITEYINASQAAA